MNLIELILRHGRTCRVLNMPVYGAMRIKKWQTIMDLFVKHALPARAMQYQKSSHTS